jgi:hypothetical protein
MDKAGKTGKVRVNPYRQPVVKSCKHTRKLAKDVRKCGRAQQETINQKVKRMLNQLFKRMAPLVAGVFLLGQLASLHAAFPYISSIQRSGNTVWITVTQNPAPTGYAEPAPDEDNYYWWVEGSRQASLDHSTSMYWAPGFTDAAVYVYPDDNSNDYSYATHHESTGGYIWNGP